MRDKRFIVEHRGGSLKKQQHLQLINWACQCAENVLLLSDGKIDERLMNALKIAKNWSIGKAAVGDARKASLNAIEVAKESGNQTAVAVARAVGHAAATAHMADHSLGAALYALKAVKTAGRSIESVRKWQNEQLSSDIRELVLSSRSKKEKDLKI